MVPPSLVLSQALVQHTEEQTVNTRVMIISPDVLLSSKCKDSIMAVPSPQLILHSLACTCVLEDRWVLKQLGKAEMHHEEVIIMYVHSTSCLCSSES